MCPCTLLIKHCWQLTNETACCLTHTILSTQKLSCRVLRAGEVHPQLFKGANRRFKKVCQRVCVYLFAEGSTFSNGVSAVDLGVVCTCNGGGSNVQLPNGGDASV